MINELSKPIIIASIIANTLTAQVFICKTHTITDYKRNYKVASMSKIEASKYITPFRISLENKILKIKGKEFIYLDSEISLEGNKYDYYKNNKSEAGLILDPKSDIVGLTITTKKLGLISNCKKWEKWYAK